MNVIRNEERAAVQAIAALADCNPFSPKRVELERRALGDAFVPAIPESHAPGAAAPDDGNAARLHDLAEHLGARLQQRLDTGATATTAELAAYQGLVLYLLYRRYAADWRARITPAGSAGVARPRVRGYEDFARDVAHFFAVARRAADAAKPWDPAHLYALGFQLCRGLHHVCREIVGVSQPAVRLRTTVWESLFTVDMGLYRDALYERMNETSTLILGKTGTGKEGLARVIGLSRYIPFDPRARSFAADPAAGYCAASVAALNSAFVGSHLFGQRRGAFPGAMEDWEGYFGTCGPYGAVFLDDIHMLDMHLQAKLQLMIEKREFQRIGDTIRRPFTGKVIAATDENLDDAIAANRFRVQLYYCLGADEIVTPTLHERFGDNPGDRRALVRQLADDIFSTVQPRDKAAEEAEALTNKVEQWVETQFPPNYPWEGNMHELETCVRMTLIGKKYLPDLDPPSPLPKITSSNGGDDGGAGSALQEALTMDELMQRHCASVYAQTGSYQETARQLDLDPRTVRTKVLAWHRRTRNGTSH